MAKKSAKRTSRKSSSKKTGASSGKPARAAAPKPVKTGPGPSPAELGGRIVADFNRGKADLNDALWSPKIVSIEGVGVNMAWHGRPAVDAKNEWWMSENRIHGASAEGPYVGATGFAIKFRMDVEEIKTGRRTIMEEVGVYTVKNGKIVQEEFMYGSQTPHKPVSA